MMSKNDYLGWNVTQKGYEFKITKEKRKKHKGLRDTNCKRMVFLDQIEKFQKNCSNSFLSAYIS